ncbi:MAG TPA: acyl-CoA dehydrogenase [Solirubrobacterales bacterium]|nr:acyl-CoA dehydrogenase [Solirubrobacterales bacterium]HMU25909.1 acyl-CoA dehydrogenase [Solirubrobacterales bacterium]HMY26280.1 acyl-CoA dehydrogenase [Solirubrobacterales bacterium]HNA22967.1 acyl-CoA dehydrogenase [Solirubrobacterales bacterium]HNC14381.1 acyl-CoA dehydrogenase [Solirubrobacterales bacterium]
MGHYKSNVRDIEFNLFEMFDTDGVLKTGAFGDLDSDTVRMMLEEASKLAEGPVAAAFESSDRTPPSFDADTHDVSLPADFKASVNAWTEADWEKIGLIEEVGGIPAPATVSWAINEFMCGALPAGFFYLAGPAFASLLYKNGNEEQKHWAQMAVEKNWGATMVLTEPEAGSDVGAGRTKAIDQGDGTWHIEGEKRFITSGDSDDLFENIFHYTLARPEGAGPGTKGLSLFVVPKWHFDSETGELGARNGVNVTSIEHKMGIKASATCDMAFGDGDNPAVGYLVGDVHQGIRQMFDVIEFARMMVGTKAIATLSTGYLNALEYAKERVQGADLTQIMDKTAPRVTVIAHPDVRRSLMTQKTYAEGLRALYLFTALHHDPVAAEVSQGVDAEFAAKINDFLLPIVKGVGSERAYEVLTESLQTYGGSGFLQDYPIEQYIRDAKIDSLYEGTTAIQAQDFFFRKIVRDEAKSLNHLLEKMDATAAGSGAGLELERERLTAAIASMREIVGSMMGYLMGSQEDPKSIYKVGLGSVQFLKAFGDLLIGWLLISQAEIAAAALENGAAGRDRDFYEGKITGARFFARNMLPNLEATKLAIAQIDNDVMELDEAAF